MDGPKELANIMRIELGVAKNLSASSLIPYDMLYYEISHTKWYAYWLLGISKFL